jgi:hypothetical protein
MLSPKDQAHPGKMHMWNARGYCWCGVHRDDGLAEAICELWSKKNHTQDSASPKLEEIGYKGVRRMQIV